MTTEERLKLIIDHVDERATQPFVTAKFGDKWKEHTKEHYDLDTIIEIAWRQGRRALLLEEVVRQMLEEETKAKKQ